MGQCSFLLTVLAFRCPLSVYSQIDSGCGIKIVAVFVSAKNTLSRHQPTNPDPGSVSTTSVQNKQPPAPNASNQNNQSTQTGVKQFSSPKRTTTSVETAPCTDLRSDLTLHPKFLQNYAGGRVRQPRTPNTSAERKFPKTN